MQPAHAMPCGALPSSFICWLIALSCPAMLHMPCLANGCRSTLAPFCAVLFVCCRRTVSLVAKYRPPMPIMVRQLLARAAPPATLTPLSLSAGEEKDEGPMSAAAALVPNLQAVVVPTLKSTRLGWKLEGALAGGWPLCFSCMVLAQVPGLRAV